ncbi:MAG TPA: hypothetical protein VK175_08105 [Leadbetterella sp.]|nr:hypothetical protein [Leadbetterella sp.]
MSPILLKNGNVFAENTSTTSIPRVLAQVADTHTSIPNAKPTIVKKFRFT